MQSLTVAIAIVESDQMVAFANRKFEDLARRGLRIVRGRMVVEQKVQQAALDRILAEAIRLPAVPAHGNSLAVRRSNGRPLLVQIIPSKGREQRGFSARQSSPRSRRGHGSGRGLPTGEAALRARGLTEGEARVARLIRGGPSPAEAAVKLGNAEGAARAPLKRAYSQIGVDRQAQWASLVARMTVAE